MVSLSNLRNKHFLALTGNMVISVFSVLTMSLLYRALSKSDVGTWFFFLTFTGLADAIRNGFLSTATIKYYAGTDPEKGSSILGSIWFLATALSFAMLFFNGAAFLFINHFTNPQMGLVIKWFGITLLSSLPLTVSLWILVAKEQYEKILWIRMTNNGSIILMIILLMISNKMSLENVFVLNFISNIITSGVCFIFGLTHIRCFIKRKKEYILSIAHFGKYSLASTLSTNLLGSSDTFIITYFLGPSALAIYRLPQRLMEIVELPLRSFIGTGISSMASALNKNRKEEVLKIFKKYAGMLTFAFIPIILFGILFADLAIHILGGSKYVGSEAANIFRIFLFCSIIYPIDRFNGVTLDIMNKPKVNLYKVLVMLTVNVTCDFIGLYIFKSMYGMALSAPFVLISGLYIGHRALKKELPYTIKEILEVGWFETKFIIDDYKKKLTGSKAS